MKLCKRFQIIGRVQGVGYRASACTQAQRLGLVGWVRNLSDGAVEALACGEAQALEAFETWLWEGPTHARVEGVVVTEVPTQSFAGFTIR